jgi:GNAT superfamily N-acetyltransferase
VTAIALRPAAPADSEFCYQLHKAAMGPYVTAIWGWDEPVQRGFHDRAFRPGRWQVITADGRDTGLLIVEYRPDEVYLARLEIHPSHQSRGIGSRLIGALADEAWRKGHALTLDVLAVNHRALALYRRLGLTEVAPSGAAQPSGGKITMRWGAPGARA